MKRFRVRILFFIFGVILIAPSATSSQTCPLLSSGDLFKVAESSAVYLVSADMKRLYFPTSEVFHTWYADFSSVQVISSVCVDNYPAPTNAPFGVNHRPGSRLVKLQISPSVYAVLPDNTLAKIGSESVAASLYGSAWAGLVRDISDVFWPNFENRATEITNDVPHDGMLVRQSGSAATYYVKDGERHEVTGTLSSATSGDVRIVSASVFNSIAISASTIDGAGLTDDPVSAAVILSIPSSQPAEETTPKPATYILEADDAGFYDNNVDVSSISAEKGAAVTITFNVRSTGVYYGGLDFRGCGQTSGGTLPGGSTTVSFTADTSCTITSYWPSSNVVKDTLQVSVQ